MEINPIKLFTVTLKKKFFFNAIDGASLRV